jgi:uncharacterized protein
MSARKSKIRRMLLTLGIGYGLLLVAGCAWQRRLLYFPTRLSPEAARQFAAREGFVPWESSNGEIIGWRLPVPGTATGHVLVVHGNAGCALDRGYLARPIQAAGALDVYVLEYPGYGARSGAPNLKSWLAAGEAAVALLPKDKPIYLVSESIGAGVAAHLAKTHPQQVAGMAMFVPFDNLASVAQSKMPLLLPYFFLRDRYQPAAWLKDYRGPVKFVIAGSDEIIPPQSGHRLCDSYAGPKQLEVVPNARHNDVAEQTPQWWREVLTFWETNRAKAGE